MRKLWHAFVAAATFFVVWLVVLPAYAWTNMAPVCDPRGATTFAPPPQIQDAEQSLDIVDDCAPESPLESKGYVRGRGAQIDISFSQESAAESAGRAAVLVFVERAVRVLDVAFAVPSGVRMSLERPPRA